MVGFDNIVVGFVKDIEIVVEVVVVHIVVDSFDLVTYSTSYIRYQTGDIVRTRLSVEMKMLRDLKKMMNWNFEASRDDQDNQYAVSIKEDTAYLCLYSLKTTKDTRLIRRIQETQYAVFKLYGNKIFWKISNVVPTPRNSNTPMDDPNITMEEYIRLEEEKARKRGKVFNWETAKYGRILYDEDVHDLRSIKNEFPAIAFNDSSS
ncbi:hypothetical protein Tco_1447860 [Tanacetum coccineum]